MAKSTAKIFECITTFAGPGLSLKRGYVGPVKADKKTIDSLLKAGFIRPVKVEKSTGSPGKGKETL